MFSPRRLTVLLIPEEGGRTYELKMPRVILWVAGVLGLGVLALLVIGFRAYSDARYLEKQVNSLTTQKEILQEEVDLVTKLEVTLTRLRSSNNQLRRILAGRSGEDDDRRQTGRGVNREPYVSAVKLMQLGRIRTVPTMWPTRGVVTGPFAVEESPGIVIATRARSLIRASAAGRVERSGFDETLGNVIVLNHGHGVKSHYGYATRILAEEGDFVYKGQPIALSGNSVQTGEPALYYAVFEDEMPRNPLAYRLWL